MINFMFDYEIVANLRFFRSSVRYSDWRIKVLCTFHRRRRRHRRDSWRLSLLLLSILGTLWTVPLTLGLGR